MGSGARISLGAGLLLLFATCFTSAKTCSSDYDVQTTSYRSPALKFRPGDVQNKMFAIEAPKGHFATRDFVAELVYENGESVPLSDVYLHHWIMVELGIPEGQKFVNVADAAELYPAHVYHHSMSVVGDGERLVLQNWAKGAETRHLNSTLPAPYGLEGGKVPPGYNSVWLLNVHGIDTRGAANRMACTECRCDLFTGGEPSELPDGYLGGLRCCVDESRCKLRDGFNGDDERLERTMYLQYTWTYVTFDECVVPLLSMAADVSPGDTVEYTVQGSCLAEDAALDECVDVQETTLVAEYGGNVVHAVSHLHAFSLDSTLWGEDGRVLCHSPPMYGRGHEAGNEKGYVVGIMHCNPFTGAAGVIKKGEKLRYQVKYSRVNGPHTGVMGIMFLKVAPEGEIQTPVTRRNRKIGY